MKCRSIFSAFSTKLGSGLQLPRRDHPGSIPNLGTFSTNISTDPTRVKMSQKPWFSVKFDEIQTFSHFRTPLAPACRTLQKSCTGTSDPDRDMPGGLCKNRPPTRQTTTRTCRGIRGVKISTDPTWVNVTKTMLLGNSTKFGPRSFV